MEKKEESNLNRKNIESLGLKYITTENFGVNKSIEYFTKSIGEYHYVLYWDNKSNNFWFLVSSVALKGPENLSINLRNYFAGDQVTIIPQTHYASMGKLEQDVFKYLTPGECCVNWGGFDFSVMLEEIDCTNWKPKEHDPLTVAESIELAKVRRIQDSISYTHTKYMTIEEIIDEYGDFISPKFIENLRNKYNRVHPVFESEIEDMDLGEHDPTLSTRLKEFYKKENHKKEEDEDKQGNTKI